ncbi:hypothetical protein T265_09966 [Opisthorchis viverrini]|uniref:MULE transposase domain-containing protein n=1 Tax=Opisthorchis viverrini TaxID=6198 RepID=A0A074Z3X1_OPIVI|nr:hypothetical protein T265_09966 [Opisthorchis viverrini]KER21781.1 hypothetical protein T265_09966 [Opisthorchis viverrini]
MYAFVESEHFAPLRKLFSLFKDMMGRHYEVKTFVVDKMTLQMRAAKAVFGCDIMLCYFHARQVIRKHCQGTPADFCQGHFPPVDQLVTIYTSHPLDQVLYMSKDRFPRIAPFISPSVGWRRSGYGGSMQYEKDRSAVTPFRCLAAQHGAMLPEGSMKAPTSQLDGVSNFRLAEWGRRCKANINDPEKCDCIAHSIVILRHSDRFYLLLSSPEYQISRNMGIYLSLPKEPNTEKIIQQALAGGRKIFVPQLLSQEYQSVNNLQGNASALLYTEFEFGLHRSRATCWDMGVSQFGINEEAINTGSREVGTVALYANDFTYWNKAQFRKPPPPPLA